MTRFDKAFDHIFHASSFFFPTHLIIYNPIVNKNSLIHTNHEELQAHNLSMLALALPLALKICRPSTDQKLVGPMNFSYSMLKRLWLRGRGYSQLFFLCLFYYLFSSALTESNLSLQTCSFINLEEQIRFKYFFVIDPFINYLRVIISALGVKNNNVKKVSKLILQF